MGISFIFPRLQYGKTRCIPTFLEIGRIFTGWAHANANVFAWLVFLLRKAI